jgi:DNA-binding transcriptional LysR family regulator
MIPKPMPRTTLEQWVVLAAVIDEGGFAAAAEALGRSQSSVSYMVRQLQEQVPVPLLETKGRKAQLTEAGAVLLRRARALLDDARSVEALAASLAQGWEPEIRLAADTIFPPALLLRALDAFAPVSRATRVELVESVLSGTQEVLLRREVDLAIAGMPPPGFLGEPLMPIEFVAVSSPRHPLQQLGRPITTQDLKAHRQLVVRDSGSRRRLDAGWLGADERWTVTNRTTQIELLKHGLGFAWVPREYVWAELDAGELAPLPLAEGGTRHQEIYLVYADRDSAGPATRELARILGATCRDECARRKRVAR